MSVLLNTEEVIRFLPRKEQSQNCIQSTRIIRQSMPEDPKLLEERKLIELWKNVIRFLRKYLSVIKKVCY